MILLRASRLALLAGMALVSAPLSADVMEIGENGARWVTGDRADMRVAAPTAIMPEEIVPLHAVARADHHASLVPAVYAEKVRELSVRFDLSPALIEALVWQESRWRSDAVSPVGARGLAQLMPGTARYLGVDPNDPYANLEGGARYLREQLDTFDGDLEKALAAYNAGPGRVMRAGGIPRIRETQNYVAAIMGRLSNHSREGS